MKKLFLSFLLLSIVLTQVAFAQDFSIQLNPPLSELPKTEYLANNEGFIELTINNPWIEDWFSVSVFGFPQEWLVVEEPVIKIPEQGSGTVLIKVEPAKDALPNIYEYSLKVKRSSTGEKIEQEMLINVKQITNAILRDIYLSCGTCTDEVLVSGAVYNVGSKLLTDLAVVAKLGNQQKTFQIDRLSVRDSKDFTFSFSLNDMSPGEQEIAFDLVDELGNSYYKDKASFTIPTVESIIYDSEVSSTPFGSSVTVKATNTGNVEAEADMSSVSPQEWYYFYSGPNPTGMILGKYYWKTALAPGETQSVTYSEIYWPTYVLIIFAVLAGVFIYWQSTALTFSKRLIRKSGSEASVSLHLRSRKRGVDKVVVKDTVPAGFSITSKFESVKPIIKKIADGVELHWNLGKMGTQEERVLHYTIKPSDKVTGTVKLPAAKAKARRHKAPLYKKSNRVSVHTGKKKSTFTVAVKE